MPNVPVPELRQLATTLIAAIGTPADLAKSVSDSLINANLAGHDSHGVLRLPGYLAAARAGDVRVAARPAVTHVDRATARVDGGWGWGQPAMWLATETVRERAREHGVGCTVVNRCFHIGRVAPYVEALARHGLVGLAMSNAGPAVAPHGGRQRTLGTNPFAWAVPRGPEMEPLSFDIATAAIAEGKLRVAQSKGLPVAPGLLLTEDGRPTIAPDDFYAGGALLAFGGHKGSGISLLAQVLGLGLAGLDTSTFSGPRGANGPVIIAIEIPPFSDPEQFVTAITALCGRIAASPPAEEVERVLLPGDLEIATRAEREQTGIPIPDTTWGQLAELAAGLEVELPVV
ncbi:MAG: Ldh family oxidoreductase [Chloroflexota bacterium]|nr:Ldh family oxidoreductase [Chloroflexota bacterium]